MSESSFNPDLSMGMIVLGWVGEILAACGQAMIALDEREPFEHEEPYRWRVANDMDTDMIRVEINPGQTSGIRENLILLLRLNGLRVEQYDNVLEVYMNV